MKSPFRKLIRISVVLFALVLLFNFFGYYLMHVKSAEDEEITEAKSVAGRQQTLSQLITKNGLLLLNESTTPDQFSAAKDSLQKAITVFKQQQEYLHKQLGIQTLPLPQSVFKIRLLLSTVQPYYQNFAAVAEEMSQADSSLISINKKLYIRQLLYNEQNYLPIMKDVTTQYGIIANEKRSEASTIDASKFLSLIIAIICLVILVLEPAFKKGETNYSELQKARNELLQEKQYLSSILQSQTNYVIRINRVGHFTYANPSFLNTFKHTKEDISSKFFYETIFPKDMVRCQQVADECWKNPGKVAKLLIKKPIGNSRHFLWTEWEFLALTDDLGEVKEIQGIGLDVTDKVMAQDVKEEAIHTLSYAMTYAKMGSWRLDFTTEEIKLSKEFKALLAIEDNKSLFLQDFVNKYIVPEDIALVKKEFTNALEHKNDKDYEYSFACRIITNQGWMRYISVKGKAMNQNTGFGIAQDVTAQKESENALLNSEQKFRLLAENSGDIISVHAADGTIWYISPSVTSVLGYDVDDVIGRSILQYVFPGDRYKFSPSENQMDFADSESIIIRYRIFTKEGPYIWLETIVKPTIDNNKVIKLICTSRNITEQKKIHEKLKKKDQLLQAVAEATHCLLINNELNSAIDESIVLLGSKAVVDRVYLFQNFFDVEKQEWCANEIKEWNLNESNSRIANPALKNIPFGNIQKIIEPLKNNNAFVSYKHTETDEQLLSIFERQQVVASLAVPIFLKEKFWGFVGFDELTEEREWAESEFSILRSYASALAGAIERKEIE